MYSKTTQKDTSKHHFIASVVKGQCLAWTPRPIVAQNTIGAETRPPLANWGFQPPLSWPNMNA